MKIRHVLVTLSLLGSFTVFSQQIGDGKASVINNFNSPLLSGFYNGYNMLGSVPEVAEWEHLINLRHSNTENNNQIQIGAAHNESDRMFFRKFARDNNSTAIAPTWNEIATRGVNTFTGQQVIIGNLALGGTQLNSNINFESQNGFHRIAFHELRFWDWEIGETMTINNGKVGIGTTDPSQNLSIYADQARLSVSGPSGVSAILMGNRDSKGGERFTAEGIKVDGNPAAIMAANGSLYFGGGSSWDDKGGTFDCSMSIDDGGNIGIGMGITPAQNKLSVNGTIWAKEVKVSLTDAADWVFEKEYKLKPLAELETYVKTNKHLPEIPSAEEFRQNDLNVSQMTNKLLQKIEELTLYTIEQQKEIETLKKQNNNYKSLLDRIETIEKGLKK